MKEYKMISVPSRGLFNLNSVLHFFALEDIECPSPLGVFLI